jgi:hypothetical protein
VLLHLGAGNWLIVDSCRDLRTGEQPAARYLGRIGVAAPNVRAIVASHWHDDHIRGLGELVTSFPAADFYCSSALTAREFLGFVDRLASFGLSQSAGTSEFINVCKTLEATGRYPRWAGVRQTLFEATRGAGNPGSRVVALSPNDPAITQAMQDISQLLAESPNQAVRVRERNPNNNAVALWVEVGSAIALLGADLEVTPDQNTGWVAVLDASVRPFGRAEVFKVPHHGSQTGHHGRVWTEMLELNPYALLTPYREMLPSDTDVRRICGLTSRGFITQARSPGAPASYSGIVRKMVLDKMRNRRPLEPSAGHVRLRRSGRSTVTNWSVELFEGAAPLSCA